MPQYGSGEHYWAVILDNAKHYTLDAEYFGRLKEPFANYSQQRLDSWYQEAIEKHNTIVDAVEDCYWDKKAIPDHFLKRFM